MPSIKTRGLVLAAALFAGVLPITGCAGAAKDGPNEDHKDSTMSQPIISDLDALRAHLDEIAKRPEHTDARVQVQHILIGFLNENGSTTVPGKGITRSKAEAEELTAELLGRINRGEDFDALVDEYTDDSHPGIYGMWLNPTDIKPGEFARSGMVPAFGNVGWKLAVSQVGVAAFDVSTSPYGYHIIKCV
jgi:hypothetical protein